jgi:hypothetical protein
MLNTSFPVPSKTIELHRPKQYGKFYDIASYHDGGDSRNF